MKIKVCSNSYTYIWEQHIPLNAWYGQDKKSWWFCTAHGKTDDGSLMLYRFDGTRWGKTLENSNTTHEIWAWAETNGLWWTKVHWFKDEDKKRSLAAKQNSKFTQYENLMKHDRKHKKSNGSMLHRENYYADKTFTDYECRNNPMHDFRKYYN